MDRVDRGRAIVTSLIAITLSISLGVDLVTAFIGTMSWKTTFIRLFLTILLCAYLYAGRNWARWVCVVLYTPTGLISLIAGTRYWPDPVSSGVLLGLGTIYLTFGLTLIFSGSVREFAAYQRGQTRGTTYQR